MKRRERSLGIGALLTVALLFAGVATPQDTVANPHNSDDDTLLSPGTGKPEFAADVATGGDRIGAIGELAGARAPLVRLGGQLMLAGKAYEYDRVLADEIGPRLTGSFNYIKAADWAYSELGRLGLSNVHREAWEINATWEPETSASARILAPHERRLNLVSDGWSPSTSPGGVRGNVYYLTALTSEVIHVEAAHIKDAIVLIDWETLNAVDPLLPGRALDAVALIASEGARALLLGLGESKNAPAVFGLGAIQGNLEPLPEGGIGREDTLLLHRMLNRGPVEVEFSFTNHIREHVNVDNIVAEIPGSDPGGASRNWHRHCSCSSRN